MEKKRIYKPYSNSKIISMSILSFLCAFTMLLLYIISASSKRPSFSDLSKYVFVTFCINFCLFIGYGICGYLKDEYIRTYGMKMLGCGAVVTITIIIMSIIALAKHHERTLPTIILSTDIAVAFIILFVTLEFFLNDASKGTFP